MAKSRKGKTPTSDQTKEQNHQPRSLVFAARGITTAQDMAGLMSAMISDLLEDRITPGVSNAICSASGKLLKVTEMQYKYGKQRPGSDGPTLALIATPETDTPKRATLIPMKRKRRTG